MPLLVQVPSIENKERLKANIETYFKKKQYDEIAQSIGMHSILMDPEHTISDQTRLYRSILTMLKERIKKSKGKDYGAWYADFPELMDKLISSRKMDKDNATADVLASHRQAYGAFSSVEDFYFWALENRRLTLDQIVTYIEKTAEML